MNRAVIVTSVAVVMFVAGCGSGAGTDVTVGQKPAPTTSTPSVALRVGPAVVGRDYPHQLYTHCGIWETRFAEAQWLTEPELSDGSSNPPAGWGNPYQSGRMRLLTATTAEFRDSAGHVVLFRLRPGASTFLRLCA